MQTFLKKKGLLILVGLLVVLRLVLPTIGLRVVNWALNEKLGQYEGKIDDFDLSLYRGAYQLQGLEIKKRNSQLPPLVTAKEIDLSIAWRALFRKEISADITVDEFSLHLIDSKSQDNKQFGNDEEKGWKGALDVLIPTSIESMRVRNSSAYFTNNELKNAPPIKLEKIDFTVKDLRNRPHSGQNALSPFNGTAILQNHAELWTKGTIDILSKNPQLDIDFRLNRFKIETINPMLLNYVPLDMTKGTLSLYLEAATATGRGEGYANVFLEEADIIADTQKFKSWKHFGFEIIGALGNWILKNQKTKSVAAHVPLHWENKDLKVDTSKAFWSALDNMKKPIPRGFENSIDLNKLKSNNVQTGPERLVRGGK